MSNEQGNGADREKAFDTIDAIDTDTEEYYDYLRGEMGCYVTDHEGVAFIEAAAMGIAAEDVTDTLRDLKLAVYGEWDSESILKYAGQIEGHATMIAVEAVKMAASCRKFIRDKLRREAENNAGKSDNEQQI